MIHLVPLFKLDIESAELSVLPALLREGELENVHQIAMEFHKVVFRTSSYVDVIRNLYTQVIFFKST